MTDQLGEYDLVFHASRLKWLSLLAFCLLVTAAGAASAADGDTSGWLILTVGALCSIFSLLMVIKRAELRIDANGMTVTMVGRQDRYEFHECSDFRTWVVPTRMSWVWPTKQVVFDHNGPNPRARATSLNKRLVGSNSSLPDNFGHKAEDLAALLNERRDHSVGPRAT